RNLDTMTGFGGVCSPREIDPTIPPELEAAVMKALAPDLSRRHLSAREMLEALAPFERAADEVVGAWVRELAGEELAKRAPLLSGTPFEASRTADDLVRVLKSRPSTPPPTPTREMTHTMQITQRFSVPEPPRLEPFFPQPPIAPASSIDPRFGAVLT